MHAHHAHHGTGRLALQATVHCLAGCTVGEILGMVLGTALGWTNATTVAASIVFSFVSGYALTMRPLLRAGLSLSRALALAFASDSLSIAIMEAVDNLFMLVVPGAMNARLDSWLFWGSLLGSLALAGVAAYPANRWLIARGRGHMLVHDAHGDGPHGPTGHGGHP